MSTTMSSAHGIDRQCAHCTLTYRYPQAKTFTCLGCNTQQPWDGWPSQSALIGNQYTRQDPPIDVVYGYTVGVIGAQRQDPSVRLDEIDLHAVHATLNAMSSDMLRQLHDRLVILHLVNEANLARDSDHMHFARVRQALAGAGVKL